MAKTKASQTKTDTPAPKSQKTSAQAAERQLVGENTQFSVSIPWKQVAVAQEKALNDYQKSSKLEGFRKGKVPTKLLAQKLGATTLRDLTLEAVLPDAYRAALQEHKYLPLTDPEVQLDTVEQDQDWKVTFTIALPPAINIDGYKEIIATLKKNHEAWKEVKAEKDASDQTPEAKEAAAQKVRSAKINAILEALLEKIEVVIPELLLRSETRRRLEDLSRQLDQLKLNLDDYLTRTNQTIEQLQQETGAQALLSLQVELLLGFLIKQEKLSIEHEAIHQALPKDRQASQAEHDYVESMLLKQRAVEYLLSL